jgi:beta-galactosidase
MKTSLSFFLLCAVLVHAQSNSERKKINFDDNWAFHFGNASDPAKDFNYGISPIFSKTGKAENTPIDPKFNDSSWRHLDVPHDWAVELPFVNSSNFDVMAHGYKPVGGLFPETSIGWYRKHFSLTPADSGKRYSIQFDGIFRDAKVWINGIFLGTNESGYIGVTYDITDFINFTKSNILVVRVDATQYEGWFYEGAGIYRHVWLIRTDNLHIANNGVFVHSEVKKDVADIYVETTIENETSISATAILQTTIVDRTGKMVAKPVKEKFSSQMNGNKVVRQKISMHTPQLWSLEDPYLYRVVSVINGERNKIDSLSTRFGIRTIEIDAVKGVTLNGKQLKIQGTNNHQDHAGVGSALPDYLQYYRIGLLKEMGVNAYRTSHNPPTPELLDACDSLGMLVLDETRLLNSSAEYMNQFERMIIRDRNHPSIFMWSIGNEEGYIHTTGTGKRIAVTMLNKQKELDPTRTATYAADVGNVFAGVNEVIPVRGFNYRHQYIGEYHRDHPQQPIVGTEMGSTVTTRGIFEKDTIRCYVPDQDITFPWWAARAEDWLPLAMRNDWMMGGFVWTGFDYRGEPTPYEWPNINSHFGLMDVCGFPKNIYYYYQSWWTDNEVLHISPHWNWKGMEGKPIQVWVNTNADSVTLFLNKKDLGTKVMNRYSHLNWDVPYEPGVLQAVGFKHGKKINAKVETTGKPYEIVLLPSKQTLSADGKDAVVVNAAVNDKEGREIPDAQNLIHFSISGPAKIIGVGNGDPSDHEPDKCEEGKWERRLFNGRCQVIIQSEVEQGEMQIGAVSDGLQIKTVAMKSFKP